MLVFVGIFDFLVNLNLQANPVGGGGLGVATVRISFNTPSPPRKKNKFVIKHFLNPLHAFPGPGSGILILTTMPIPDRVRASLQLIG